LHGDFGDSVRFQVPVWGLVRDRLGNTAMLGLTTFAVLVPLSLILGVLAGMRAGSLQDRLISLLSVITTSIPEFASAVFLSALFVFRLAWLPGTSSMAAGFTWQELILPAAVLVLADFGYVTRMTRAAMVEVMATDYVRTAILKGLPYRVVIVKHALRNALMTPLTVLMLQVNWLLSGVIVVEFFFAYKGFGALLLEASLNQDLYVIEACTLVAVGVAVLSQTLADVGYAWLNPRVRTRS
jgi:peptide/nickel transport system permease protein